MPKFAMHAFWVLIWKDWRIGFRNKAQWANVLVFALVLSLLFQFAWSSGEQVYRINHQLLVQMQREGATTAELNAWQRLQGQNYATQTALARALREKPHQTEDTALSFDDTTLTNSTLTDTTLTNSPLTNSAPKTTPPHKIASKASKPPAPALSNKPSYSIQRLQKWIGLARYNPLQDQAPALLWIIALFAGVIGVQHTLAREFADDCMGGLLLSPIPRSAIYFSKVVVVSGFVTGVLTLLIPLFALWFSIVPTWQWVLLWGVLIAGSIGFSAIGVLVGLLTAGLKGEGALLPVVLYPLLVPLLLVCVQMTRPLLLNQNPLQSPPWWGLLIAFDLLFLVTGGMVFSHVVEE